jgi:hypothetical protein
VITPEMQRLAHQNLAKLPGLCAAWHPFDATPIFISAGEPGHYRAFTGLDVDGFNARHKITPAQVEAMIAGSLFGWHVPGADPDTYNLRIRPIL